MRTGSVLIINPQGSSSAQKGRFKIETPLLSQSLQRSRELFLKTA
jgi:hypothetical protein